MISRFFITIFAILFIIFLLSVFGPKDSERGFWVMIFKTRRVMDKCCYNFFKLYLAAIVAFIVLMNIYKLFV